jgi:hypothetical protein
MPHYEEAIKVEDTYNMRPEGGSKGKNPMEKWNIPNEFKFKDGVGG